MNNSPFLLVDTSVGEDSVEVAFVKDGQETTRERVNLYTGDAQDLLVLLTDVLEQHGLVLSDIGGVGYVHGAERFTASRVSAVMMNTLAWSRGVPVVEYDTTPQLDTVVDDLLSATPVTHGNSVSPQYSKDPRISQ